MANTNMNFFASNLLEARAVNNKVNLQPRAARDLLDALAVTLPKLRDTLGDAIRHNTSAEKPEMVAQYTHYFNKVSEVAPKAEEVRDAYGYGLDQESPKAKM